MRYRVIPDISIVGESFVTRQPIILLIYKNVTRVDQRARAKPNNTSRLDYQNIYIEGGYAGIV